MCAKYGCLDARSSLPEGIYALLYTTVNVPYGLYQYLPNNWRKRNVFIFGVRKKEKEHLSLHRFGC